MLNKKITMLQKIFLYEGFGEDNTALYSMHYKSRIEMPYRENHNMSQHTGSAHRHKGRFFWVWCEDGRYKVSVEANPWAF